MSVLNVNNTVGSNGSTNGSALYFGFYDLANSYKSVAFGNSQGGIDGFGYENLSIGTIQQVTPRVPEPPTMSVFGAGLVGVAALRRRNRKA